MHIKRPGPIPPFQLGIRVDPFKRVGLLVQTGCRDMSSVRIGTAGRFGNSPGAATEPAFNLVNPPMYLR